MADLRELIKKWRIAAMNAGKARAKAFTRCADELERALAAQPAPSEDEALGWEPAEVFAYAWMNDENEWCFSERKPSFVAEFRLKRLGLVGASQPASVGADAEAVEALQAAVNACDRPIFTEKAEAAASWAAVSFVQSYGKQVLRRLDGTGGE